MYIHMLMMSKGTFVIVIGYSAEPCDADVDVAESRREGRASPLPDAAPDQWPHLPAFLPQEQDHQGGGVGSTLRLAPPLPGVLCSCATGEEFG